MPKFQTITITKVSWSSVLTLGRGIIELITRLEIDKRYSVLARGFWEAMKEIEKNIDRVS